MKCPECNQPVNIKRNNLYNCICGAVLIAVKVNEKLIIVDVRRKENVRS